MASKKTVTAAVAGSLVATVLAVGGYRVAFPKYDSIGSSFATRGYASVSKYRRVTDSVWTSSYPNLAARITALPNTPLWYSQYAARYGHTVQQQNGLGAGERYSADALQEVMNAPANPLQMACNPNCVVEDDSEFEYDAKILASTGKVLGWDAIVEPAYAALHPPVPTPTPVPPTPIPTPTPAPPTPTPTPTPPPQTQTGAWSVREVPCSTGSACLEVKFTPSTASTGRGGVSVVKVGGQP